MTTSSVEPFPNNWAYLRAELNWLERLLIMAIARQRREWREVNRVAQSRADRVTSHWWKGMIVVEGEVAYDDRQRPGQRQAVTRGNWDQQLEARIQASYQQGVPLGLPLLRDRLQLTPFEKKVVLASLAPEVNRRYARLYNYLQSCDPSYETSLQAQSKRPWLASPCPREEVETTELLIVDLALRLLCRNDIEWQAARSGLAGNSRLVQLGLIELITGAEDTLLTSRLKPSVALTSYLLSACPDQAALERLLSQAQFQSWNYHGLQTETIQTQLDDLVLPARTVAQLHYLCCRQQYQASISCSQPSSNVGQGTIALFTGAQGTGKMMAARALAHTLNHPLTWVDLSLVQPSDYLALLRAIRVQQPIVLLIRHAQHWLGKSSQLSEIDLNQFLHQRRAIPCLTLFTTNLLPAIPLPRQRQMDAVVEFLIPDWRSRRQLWQRACASAVPTDPNVDWDQLARQWRLTGGQIQTIVRNATIVALAANSPFLTLDHILQAISTTRL
ncbi:MAG: ATP-binding protein [Cyanobacteria bacterium]|nr:ATP-binding protein [Cyanobacteriota bacterium]MDW8200189.1 ATP-binding protein [Cyanobacteriota bacterium SKYGB_h_bin112]